MEQIIKFIAYDGKEFEDEDECFKYEWKQKMKDPNMKKHLKIYDCNKKEIINWSLEIIEEVYFVQLLTLEGMKFFYDWCNKYDIESPFYSDNLENKKFLGLWGWEPFDWLGGWSHIDTVKNDIDRLIQELNEKND